jgi:S1-C subfamily serine protease
MYLQAKAQNASSKPYLGATLAILDSLPVALKKTYQPISKNGVTIQKVFEDSPAKKAGLEVHDIIQKLNDSTIINPRQFVDLLWTYKAGEQINLTLYRNGKKMVKPVKLMAKPDTELR